uniref:Uncharacterized protein n=1 Tax=Tanacetum cinerariifolium TaxID=118510 RepID=A0A699W1C2_TANCI|nr:hypothetical protein [Tanacetum cinerariifolium]
MAIEDQFQQHAAAGARTAPARDRQHAAGDDLAAERVVTVDHLTGKRLDPAPETQGHGWGHSRYCGQRRSCGSEFIRENLSGDGHVSNVRAYRE